MGKASGSAPPLTVTGVAPWAMHSSSALGNKRVAPVPSLSNTPETAKELQRTGFVYVLASMETLKPPVEEDGISSWSLAQMAETPTLLPHLKFHDLVFGHDLGTGAFGCVKYARLIDKSKPRSQWPEYAVKVVSTEMIRSLGYEASIQREIAVLHFLSHPGIARLVSSFRFQDGAYLVLEYASRGDLHTLLQKHGSLDIDSTRFVIGEVVAALVRF
jgi:Protein kinase domain